MRDKKLPSNIFKCIVKNTPLISIDLIVEVQKDLFLLGKRKNPPAKGFFFVPGGRIFKNEKIKEAFTRIVINELNLKYPFEKAKFLGVFEHIYDENVFGEENFGTHYIVLAYYIYIPNLVDISKLPLEQHEEYKLFSKERILSDNKVHLYTKLYFEEVI